MKASFMAAAIFLSLLGLRTVAQAQPIPDIVCTGNEVVYIDHSNLTMSKQPSTDLYRFASGKLYLSSKDREEYLYNDVREVEPGRYVSAYMTIHFGNVTTEEFRKATAVHTDSLGTKVVSLSCTRTRK